jgi:putative glycosyltransferase
MHLSIVSTLYLSSSTIEKFVSSVIEIAEAISESYEIILVNDGSPDDSLDKAIQFSKKNSRIKIIDLSKNFGHHKAMMTGLSYAKGEFVFLIDSDLEEDPNLLTYFYKEIENNPELDQVYGVQAQRKGSIFEKTSGILWYRIVNLLVEEKIPENFLTVRLMTKRFVDNLTQFKERELNFSTLIALNGFNSKSIKVEKGHKNSSSYNILKKLNITINTITSSSTIPLWLIFYFGLFINLLSFSGIVYVLTKKFIYGGIIHGWSSLMLINLCFGGTIILSLGVIGLYISKILRETKERPYSIIKAKYNLD